MHSTGEWNARKVYRLYDNAVGFYTIRYLLCYVLVRLDWEPAAEQKGIMAEKFCR